jgi:hypothetical protein
METSFTINQDLTFKESMSSTLYYILTSKRFRLFVLFLAGLTVMSNLLSPQGIEAKKILWGFVSILMTGTILFLFMIILTLVFRKTRPSIFKFSYHFTHWGMAWNNNEKEFSKSWKEIDTFKESKAFFFLYTDKYNVHVMQKKLFKDQYDVFAFRDLLKEKINK